MNNYISYTYATQSHQKTIMIRCIYFHRINVNRPNACLKSYKVQPKSICMRKIFN